MSTLTSYILGYALSILLTLAAVLLYLLHIYTHHTFPTHGELRVLFAVLAAMQVVVQLSFFLHVGHEQKSEWKAVVLGFALFTVIVVVGGTLWIMQNLQHNMHMPNDGTFLNNSITVQNEND